MTCENTLLPFKLESNLGKDVNRKTRFLLAEDPGPEESSDENIASDVNETEIELEYGVGISALKNEVFSRGGGYDLVRMTNLHLKLTEEETKENDGSDYSTKNRETAHCSLQLSFWFLFNNRKQIPNNDCQSRSWSSSFVPIEMGLALSDINIFWLF